QHQHRQQEQPGDVEAAVPVCVPVAVGMVTTVAPPERGRGDRQYHDRGGHQQRPHSRLHVTRIVAGECELEQGTPDKGEDQRVQFPPHSSTAPTATAASTATTNVAGANRTANRRPNAPACIANSFASTIGPTTRNARRAVQENCVSDAATNASASEQMDSTTARNPRASTDSTGWPPTACSSFCGTATLSVAAVNPPMTRYPPACTRSVRQAATNAAALPSPASSGRCGTRSHSVRPSRNHSQPMTTDATRLATNRATTICGRPGNAT